MLEFRIIPKFIKGNVLLHLRYSMIFKLTTIPTPNIATNKALSQQERRYVYQQQNTYK